MPEWHGTWCADFISSGSLWLSLSLFFSSVAVLRTRLHHLLGSRSRSYVNRPAVRSSELEHCPFANLSSCCVGRAAYSRMMSVTVLYSRSQDEQLAPAQRGLHSSVAPGPGRSVQKKAHQPSPARRRRLVVPPLRRSPQPSRWGRSTYGMQMQHGWFPAAYGSRPTTPRRSRARQYSSPYRLLDG